MQKNDTSKWRKAADFAELPALTMAIETTAICAVKGRK